MNLLALSPALKVATGLAVGAAFAGAVALTATHGGGGPRQAFNAGTIDVTPTAFVEKRPTFPNNPAPVTKATPVVATPQTTPGPKSGSSDCPKDWQFFDNTVLKYTMCLPPGWAFSDGVTPDAAPASRVTSTLTEQHGDILAASADGIPFPVAQTLSAAEGSRYLRSIRLSIATVPQGIAFGGCTPTPTKMIGGLTALSCDDVFSDVVGGGQNFSPTGDRMERKVLIPWFTSPPRPTSSSGSPGYFLLIKVLAPVDRFVTDGVLIDAVLENVRGYK